MECYFIFILRKIYPFLSNIRSDIHDLYTRKGMHNSTIHADQIYKDAMFWNVLFTSAKARNVLDFFLLSASIYISNYNNLKEKSLKIY